MTAGQGLGSHQPDPEDMGGRRVSTNHAPPRQHRRAWQRVLAGAAGLVYLVVAFFVLGLFAVPPGFHGWLATDGGVDIDLALFGFEPGGWVAPRATNGASLVDEGTILLSSTAKEAGVKLGDVLTVAPAGNTLKVAGFLDGQHTFGHVDVGYVPLRTWQEVRAGVRPGEPVPARVYEEVTAVAVRAAPGADVDLLAGDDAAGTMTLTLQQSFGASPGFTAETSTLNLIQGFLYAISALVVGAFFTVLAEPVTRFHQSLQEPLVAALRAHGEPQPQLVADLIDSMVVRASRDVWEPEHGTTPSTLATSLELLHKLLGPYLGSSAPTDRPPTHASRMPKRDRGKT